MWKKITSFFFDEEEIEIEDEPIKEKEAYVIPELKPYNPNNDKKEKIEKPIENVKEEVVERPTHKHEDIVFDPPVTKKKSFGIDLEEKPEVTITKKEPTILPKPKVEETYSRKEIISPMYGGPKGSVETQSKAKVELKSRRPTTPIISPIFGKVEDGEGGVEENRTILDMKLDEIIKPETKIEEEQTSLYDYLEGLDDEK